MKNRIARWSLALLITTCATLTVSAAANASQEKRQEQGEAPAVQAEKAKAASTDAEVIATQLPFYPLTTCVVSDEELGADAVSFVIDGNLYRTCCAKCETKVKADSATARAKIERAVVAAQKPLWPLTVCPISNEAYGGEMGEPIDVVEGMRYAKLCCKGCKRGIAKNPDRVFAAVDKAWIAEQTKTYPLMKCVISDEELGSMGEPIDRMYGTTLVRLCCKGCNKTFDKDPAKYAKQVKDARIDRRRGKAKEAGAPKDEPK